MNREAWRSSMSTLEEQGRMPKEEVRGVHARRPRPPFVKHVAGMRQTDLKAIFYPYSEHIRSRSPIEKIFPSVSSINFVKGIKSSEQRIRG